MRARYDGRRSVPEEVKKDTAVGFPHTERCGMNWALSCMRLATHEPRIGMWYPRFGEFGNVAKCRNAIVEVFLESEYEYLFWIDTDVGFEADALSRLHAHGKDIICGIYWATQEVTPDDNFGFQIHPAPCVYLSSKDKGVVPAYDLAEVGGLREVDAMGGGFCLIHRKVYEKIGSAWYDLLPLPDGRYLAEDLSFCKRARDWGFKLWCDADLKTNHLKAAWLGPK